MNREAIRGWLEIPARFEFETAKRIRTLEYIEELEAKLVEYEKPLVHAYWIDRDGKTWCSKCGAFNKAYKPPFCPRCGAKMDGRNE